MIWYGISIKISLILFFVMLLTTAFQAVIALEAGDITQEKRKARFIRLLYILLTTISAVCSAEALLAIASIEGGVFLMLPALPRYLSVLPALLFLYMVISPLQLPPLLRPPTASFFIPLLRLPLTDGLPIPLSIALTVFATAWLMMDALRMLLCFRMYSRTEITRNVMPHIIRNISHGICVADRGGWILEGNPAFYDLCNRLGIPQADRVHEIDAALEALCDAGRLYINDMGDSQFIKTDNGIYLLQRSSFTAGRRTFIQLALSDTTNVTRAATMLEQENNILAQKNREMENVIFNITQEEIVRERERLCRSAHDFWSQRLAVAGLAVDILLTHEGGKLYKENIAEVSSLLEDSAEVESFQSRDDLQEALCNLTDMYRKLGVSIRVSGRAGLTGYQQKMLCPILREAFANAVRHAYARSISVLFFEGSETVGITIHNDCLDDQPGVVEGRGLYDMKIRIQQAGGVFQYEKNNQFRLQIAFPKVLLNQQEALAL